MTKEEATYLGVTIPLRRVRWQSSYRLIFGKRTTIELFDDLAANKKQMDILKNIESKTNERIQIESGQFPKPEGIIPATGEGSSMINSPFLHIRKTNARFAAIGDRITYLSKQIETAIHECIHWQGKRAKLWNDPPGYLEMRVQNFQHIDASIHVISGLQNTLASIYDLEDYQESIKFAHYLKSVTALNGILYDSLRDTGGTNLAAFKILSGKVTDSGFVMMIWDGEKISDWFKVS